MKLLIASLLVVGFSSIAGGEPGTSPTARTAEEEAVHKAVDEIVAAIDRNDADAFDRLSTADYTFVNPAGKVWNKKEYLEIIPVGHVEGGLVHAG